MSETIRDLLAAVAGGALTPAEAEARLRVARASEAALDLGFATLDLERAQRCGAPEVVFGQGKAPAHTAALLRALHSAHGRGLATRVAETDAPEILAALADLPVRHEVLARCVVVEASPPPPRGRGPIALVTAGTTDAPVAAEAEITLRFLGHEVRRIDDVGVAGLHRLLARLDALRTAEVLVVCAGMEAALASVVAGLVDRPIVAVPTSVGYGASFGGLAALLGLLNACASGVTVVNIDNGFGAAFAAARINGHREIT
jgi:NCAIR mutase (PurE)-related protein